MSKFGYVSNNNEYNFLNRIYTKKEEEEIVLFDL